MAICILLNNTLFTSFTWHLETANENFMMTEKPEKGIQDFKDVFKYAILKEMQTVKDFKPCKHCFADYQGILRDF